MAFKKNKKLQWSVRDEKQFRKLLKRRMRYRPQEDIDGYDIKFVMDLLAGEEGERIVSDAIKTAEIKRDAMCGKTGNLFVETGSRNKHSGLEKTSADFWIFLLSGVKYRDEIFVGVSTDRLRELLKDTRPVTGGDAKTSLGYLLPLVKIFDK